MHESAAQSGAETAYQQLLESMPVMLWTANAQGVWYHVNQAWIHYTGVIGETRGFGFEAAVHPDDLPRVLPVWQAAIHARRLYEIEYRLHRHDGIYRWFLIRGIPVPNDQGSTIAWVGTCTDIQAQKQAEEDAVVAQEAAIRALGLAMEARDHDTLGHTDRVTELSQQLGHTIGLDQYQLDALRLGSYLHDIGKLTVPDYVLLKPGPLNADEWQQMRAHVEQGVEFAQELGFLPQDTVAVVEQHHERWDGTGYPAGRAGTEIHPLARLFSVVDVYDALVSKRPYKIAVSPTVALEELRRQRGKQFDPDMVDAFLELQH